MNNKLRIEVLKGWENLSIKEMDDRIKYRGLDCKRINRINEAIECYENKIPRIENILEEEKDKDVRKILTEKIDRLKDKLACCIKELELRERKIVNRTNLHDTIYYIDLTNGNDANDGLAANNDHSWLTIGKYTTTTVRTAGDIAYVRANTTQTLGAIIQFDEDGTFNAPISIIGCDAVTNDPWGDVSNVLPIVDANGGAYYLYLNTDNYWYLERLDLRNSSNRVLYFNASHHSDVISCIIRDSASVGTLINSSAVSFYSCTFYNNGISNVNISGSAGGIEFYDCVFNKGTTCSYGIVTNTSIAAISPIYLYNCSFGQTTAHTTADISLGNGGILYGQNCILQNTTIAQDTNYHGIVYFEDWQQVKGSHYSVSPWAIITSDSDIKLDTLNSIKLSPTTNSKSFHWGTHQYGTFKLWLVTGNYTISIKARETAAWANDPNSSAFFFRASYLNHASNATRTFVDSAQSLSGTSEITFTMAVAPAQDGFVYVTPYLIAYESGKSINYSIQPSVA